MKRVQAMKKMVIQLTPELRKQLKDVLESKASEMTISYDEEPRDGQLDQVQGGARAPTEPCIKFTVA